MSRGKEKWDEFEKQYQVEQIIYQIAQDAIQILRNKLGDEAICGFAFCPDSYYGNLTLSYNIYDGEYSGSELKENEFFPPDWSDEVDEELCDLCRERFETPIGTRIQEIQDEEEEDESFGNEFGEAYINSVRKVLVRLENENAFSALKTTDDIWLIVTEIDADTDEEENKLNEIRKQYKFD